MKKEACPKFWLPVTCLALVSLTSACGTFGVIYEDVGHPPIAVVPRDGSAPMGWDPNLNASMGGRELLERGVACSQDILKLVAWGDATQAAAAKQGGITQVVGLDFENTAILGFIYSKSCTVVYGNAEPVAETPSAMAPQVPPPSLPAEQSAPVAPAAEPTVPTEPAPNSE